MAPFPSLPQEAEQPTRRQQLLEQTRDRYEYMEDGNQLRPISIARCWHCPSERRAPSWYLKIGPRFVAASGLRYLHLLHFGLQGALFRFDKMRAYDRLLPRPKPRFAELAHRDEAFAYWRIAGPNPLLLEQERSLTALRHRIPLDTLRIEKRLGVSLEAEAEQGRLFAVDFRLVQSALRRERTRDSRWRDKYLPAPIGVFVEADTALVPLAIQIDQRQPDQRQPSPEHNPVYYPDDNWGWRIAKLYFEVADQSFHVACGHVGRTHLVVGPFCLATPRQLSREHPVFVLLRPHTRFTLQANQAAYEYFTDRRWTYQEFYSGTLEETREIAIQGYREKSFAELGLERELASRGVRHAPAVYPYRDDALLWLEPIRDFVTAYIGAFYGSDAAVQKDHELQAWAGELVDEKQGAVRELVPENRLDSRAKLIDVLAQVIFIAGPGHASQHFSANFYHRYAPAFPAAAYAPPPWQNDRAHEDRFRNTLPPIRTASNELRYSTFTNLQYDRFGHYDRYPLGRRVEQAREPIARLQAALAKVEDTIRGRQANRFLPYEFLLPSRVPNSANI